VLVYENWTNTVTSCTNGREQLTEKDLDNLIEEIDTDGSGTVDFDEFMEMMTG